MVLKIKYDTMATEIKNINLVIFDEDDLKSISKNKTFNEIDKIDFMSGENYKPFKMNDIVIYHQKYTSNYKVLKSRY